MRVVLLCGLGLTLLLAGCGMGIAVAASPAVTSVIPSATGTPNSVTTLGNYDFVSVQGTGEIYTYDISSGSQAAVGHAYKTPCVDPSGMVIANIGATNVMAVACFDTGTLLTLTVHADGTLSALGSVSGLPSPYPGLALEGTNVFVPLFGVSQGTNGAVAKVSLAYPATPVVTGVATLASPVAGGFANPGFLAAANGKIFVAGGSESAPLASSSTVQVVDEATMTVVGSPLSVAHSPQQLVVMGTTLYATFFDAEQVESIDVSAPAKLKSMQVFSLAGCSALALAGRGTTAYVGCYEQGAVESLDVSDPTAMKMVDILPNVGHPQGFSIGGSSLLMTDGVKGGAVYQIPIGPGPGISGKV